MKILIIILISFIIALPIHAQSILLGIDEHSNYEEINMFFEANIDKDFDKRKGSKPLRRWQYF